MPPFAASSLTLQDVHQQFGLQRGYVDSYSDLLTLEPLTEYEQQDVLQTREDWNDHLATGSVSEGQVKLLSIGPLLRLARFYHRPLRIWAEEGITQIQISDGEQVITGRLDILAVHSEQLTPDSSPFWVLVIESKGSAISPSAGLPQLLTYAYSRLQQQQKVWGLVSNGEYYRFVQIQAGAMSQYALLPSLNLTDVHSAQQIVQVLKAIRQAQVDALPVLSVAG
ncbi:MAG: restriction endonuclease subunit R [Spirulina sp. SIO3F2]|nr:restriction endonuclease subunit R [Spirulina sp. SIO3F2]